MDQAYIVSVKMVQVKRKYIRLEMARKLVAGSSIEENYIMGLKSILMKGKKYIRRVLSA